MKIGPQSMEAKARKLGYLVEYRDFDAIGGCVFRLPSAVYIEVNRRWPVLCQEFTILQKMLEYETRYVFPPPTLFPFRRRRKLPSERACKLQADVLAFCVFMLKGRYDVVNQYVRHKPWSSVILPVSFMLMLFMKTMLLLGLTIVLCVKDFAQVFSTPLLPPKDKSHEC